MKNMKNMNQKPPNIWLYVDLCISMYPKSSPFIPWYSEKKHVCGNYLMAYIYKILKYFNVLLLICCWQVYNANQLSKWCLHFIATNHAFFEHTKEINTILEENREFLEHHYWPPKVYMEMLEEYKKNLPGMNKKLQKKQKVPRKLFGKTCTIM